MVDVEELTRQMLLEGREDHLGLWWIVKEVSERMGPAARDQVKSETLSLIRRLLDRKVVEAGFPTPDGRGFEAWKGTSEETVARIEAAWDELEGEPGIGDVVWLNTTTDHEPAGRP